MTEGWGAHNGDSGNTETPPAEPPRRRGRRSTTEPDQDTGDTNYRGQWQARNDDGKFAVTSSELAALKFACPPDRVKPYKHGDPIDV